MQLHKVRFIISAGLLKYNFSDKSYLKGKYLSLNFRNMKHLIKIIIILFLSAIICLSCAASKYQKAETLYGEEAFEQLINSNFECQDTSASCFRLKYLQMESYTQLGDWKNVLLRSREAIDRITPAIPLNQMNRVYLLHTELVLEKFSELGNRDEQILQLRMLISDLHKAIAINRDSVNSQKVSDYRLLLTQTLLLKMDHFESKNLEIIHEDIMEVLAGYDEQLKSSGYDKYYKLQADLKLYLPEIRKWIYRGEISRNREELLIKLKDIYKKALNLRKIPLYQQGYAEQIEAQLREIDEYMKQLII